jgi:hypothetical protein
VLAPDTVVAPFSVYGGCPAVFLRELPESAHQTTPDTMQNFIQNKVRFYTGK